MNRIEQPPVESTNGTGAGHAYDDLLRAFFRAEMPAPWPTFEVPEPATLSITRSRTAPIGLLTRTRSRVALAASIAILLLGSWLLSGAFPRDCRPAAGSQAGWSKPTEPGVNSGLPDTATPQFKTGPLPAHPMPMDTE